MATSENVSAAKPATGGAVYVAATGTTLPTTASAALETAFTCLGYISDDGLRISNGIDTETIKAWGGDEVLVLYNGRELKVSFTLIEGLNVDVLSLVYGSDNVSETTEGAAIVINSDELDSKSIVIDMVLRNGALKRIVLPNAALTDLGDISYSDSEAFGYDITLTALSDDDGARAYEYIANA